MELNLECDFIVAGFDQRPEVQTAHVVAIVNPGKAVNEDACGFSAVGLGAAIATNTLLFHSFNNQMDLYKAIYHVCEAKFMSEQPGIGQKTSVVVLARDGGNGRTVPYDCSDDLIADIRKAWYEDGKPRFADSAEAILALAVNHPNGRFRRVVFG